MFWKRKRNKKLWHYHIDKKVGLRDLYKNRYYLSRYNLKTGTRQQLYCDIWTHHSMYVQDGDLLCSDRFGYDLKIYDESAIERGNHLVEYWKQRDKLMKEAEIEIERELEGANAN